MKTLATGSTRAVSATLKLAGSSVSLTGSYDPASGAFSLSGGGYTLTGMASAGGFSGTYTGPNGSGSFVLLPASQGDVSVFCGAFKGDDDGVWNVSAIQGGSAVGAYASRSGTTGTFAGDWKNNCLLYTSPSPRDRTRTRMPSSD